MGDNPEAVSSEQDDVSFLRTDDIICLSCTVQTGRDAGTGSGERVCLAAEGFGNRYCFLETVSDKDRPPDLASCMLVIEQALSVRALQEMVNATSESGTQSGHRTLLYGHAVLLRHFNSDMYLTCLSTSSSSDKLAFDVGLRETAQGEACWWTIHPASKQRSEGEKVRVGDDLILVSVATERYLHTLKTDECSVIASFHQTLWTVLPIASGNVKNKFISFVFGQEVVRFFHGHDECMTIPENWSDHPQHNLNVIVYEGGEALNRARSLWRIELIRNRWNGGFINWKQAFRIQHITTGRFMSVTENPTPESGKSRWRVSLVPRNQSKLEDTAFFLKANKDDKEHGLDEKEKEEEGMGASTIKYGDTMFVIQHCITGLWLSYDTVEETRRGVGKVEVKYLSMSEEGHMDDTLSFTRSQHEESRSARVIRKCVYLFNKFNRALDALQNQPTDSRGRTDSVGHAPTPRFNLRETIDLLKDLIGYFAQPEDGTEHEAKQVHLRALRNRQDLFQQEGVLSLVLDTIDKISALTNHGILTTYQGDEGGWDEISTNLYLLIAAMIKGNHGNCAQFAQSARLNWLFSQLSQQGSEGVLGVLHCVLVDSPEALNMIREDHIRAIISLLDRSGRDHKVLDVLGSLCVGNGLAVRSSQNHICQHLLPGKDLLLQTKLVDHVASMHPNIYVGYVEGSAIFKKWYFEAIVDHLEPVSNHMPHVRIGWANTDGYVPYPGGGERWGTNGVGDDMFSFGFDGINIWIGGYSRAVRMYDPSITSGFHKGDIVGCNLDLTIPEISFSLNGIRLRATIRNFNTTGMFFPVVSMSARSSVRFMLGGDHGRLKHGPPSGYSAVIESLLPKETLRIEPRFFFGDINRSLLAGPSLVQENVGFVPAPIDTSSVILPNYIMQVRDRLAENIHELWGMSKIEAGWTYGEVRNDPLKHHPNLTAFKNLPISERNYDITLSVELLKCLLALGYHVSMIPTDARIRQMKLSSTYTQPNGYKPAPLDLCSIQLSSKMEELVEILSENIHNLWAKTRIDQGWTYGLTKQPVTKRSPHLVHYVDVDDTIKKINRDTACEAVRTLLAFGYTIEPPAGDSAHKPGGAAMRVPEKKQITRSYRAEKTYAVTEGKWYYEFEVMTHGYAKIGWALVGCSAGIEMGADENSYVFDGLSGRKWHQGPEPFGRPWQVGDVLGCLLDLHDKTISFTLNGELLVDPSGNEAAFENVTAELGGFVPACTLGAGERGRFNFGQDIHSLKFFTACGLQEGYEPFCVNMTKPVPFWYDREQAMFVPVTDENSMLEVSRIPPTAGAPPAIKLSRRSQGVSDRLQMEFLRLSLPITCREQYINDEEKQRMVHDLEIAKRATRRNPSVSQLQRLPGAMGGKIEEHMISGGFSENDIQGLTSQGRFITEESVDMMETGDMEPPEPVRNVPLPRGSMGPEKFQRQRGIMKKTQSLDVNEDMQISVPINANPYATVQTSSKRMHRSSSENRLQPETASRSHEPSLSKTTTCCVFIHDSTPAAPDGKAKKRSQSPFSYLTKKIKESASKRSASKERPENTYIVERKPMNQTMTQVTSDGMLRTPDITLAAGTAGGPALTLRMPTPLPSFTNAQDLMTPTPDIEMMTPRVAFGVDDQNRPLSGLSGMSDVTTASSTVFDLVTEFHYAVRIFPGQDPKCVYIGWVTSDFHHAQSPFALDYVRRAEAKILDVGGQLKSHCFFQNSYLVCAGDLQEQAANQGGQDKGRASPGLLIGTTIDVATGMLTFNFNGREIEERYQIEPATKLYPAVFVEPTSKEVLQFEFTGNKSALPLSSALFLRDRSLTPQCPPRLRVLTLRPNQWSRVPSQFLRVHELKMSDVRGWSMLCDDPVSILALYIPEEARCIDILELIENEDLLLFHAHTLMLYCAICSHGNYRVAHALVKHVDQKQLLFAIQNPYMSGALRRAFYDLLIALHLDTYAKAMYNTRDEYVIPVAKRESGKRRPARSTPDLMRQQSVRDMSTKNSIRPALNMKDKISSEGEDQIPIKQMTCPSFPLTVLKEYVMDALVDGVRKGTAHCRDPIGGNYENLFVPLLKIVDQLLLVGFIEQNDMDRLLMLVDPPAFGGVLDHQQMDRGLLHIRLDEGVKLQLCYVLQDLCDERVRKRIEEIVYFSEEFVGKAQTDQLNRYIDIKASDLPSSVAAKKTKEFRCPPKEQMKMLLSFKHPEEEESASCPSPEDLREHLAYYHSSLVDRLGPKPQEREVLTEVIKKSVISWAAESHIDSQELIKEMFSLLHRQYDGVGEVLKALEKAYVISNSSHADVTALLASLGRVRTLLSVQMEKDEEAVLRVSLWELMNNRVFFQHPDLIGMLCIHENVMTVMMNTIGKSQNVESDRQAGQSDGQKDSADMVVACCKFLCYFCRTSRHNQKAMFEHLGYLLDNSSMLLYRPSLRGSAPLDVAYCSLMDNSELALSLREHHLEKIAVYLSRCGLQSSSGLVAKGYADIGWDPVEGERYLDFLRFCVWVNGESMEENANLVVRLLIRRPECLGPALRGGGQGLLNAMKDAITLSESTAVTIDPTLKEDEDYIDMGEAVLNFYSVLVDLLGRCSPDTTQLAHARSDSVRARAILQSLIPLPDLEGVLSMQFFIPNFSAIEAGSNELPEMPPTILPNHKQAVLVFLERVYGVEDPEIFFRLLEESFLPDMRCGTMMDGSLASESDVSLALNRYLCNSVLPLLTRQSSFFATATQYSSLLDATLHTAYSMSKVRNLTKNQREVISTFLLALIREIDPAMMERLLRKLIVDVSALSEHTTVALKLLTSHYERCAKYYGSPSGFGSYGTASEAEKRLTMMLFSRIFDSLAGRSYDPELFNYALPCLSAIGSALPPDYALVKTANDEQEMTPRRTDGRIGYQPSPVETSTLFLSPDLQNMAVKFAEHYHDAWALKQYEAGWGYHPTRSDADKVHPFMQPYNYLPAEAKEDYRLPAEQAVKAILAWGWTLERGEEDSRGTRSQLMKRRPSRGLQELPYGYMPRPVELNNLTLNREMLALAERLAENAHDIWSQGVQSELNAAPERGVVPHFVPFDLLTDREKKVDRERSQELLKFLIYSGYRFKKERPSRNTGERGSISPPSEIESRFAYSLLEKLLHYCDVTLAKMRNTMPSSTLTRRQSYKEAPGDVKFFSKVVLPLVEQYFRSQKNYFLQSPAAVDVGRIASPKEKEMVASLFCRLAMLLRTKVQSFGHDTQIAVQCLQVLVQTIDANSLIKNSLDFVRTSFLTFFNQAAADLTNTVTYLKTHYFPAPRGTTPKQSVSLGYVEGVLLRVLTSLFDHIGANNFGKDILINDIQIACYSILDSLYTLGTNLTLPASVKLFEEISLGNRPLIGACLAAFASTFPVAFLEPEFNANNPFCILGRAQEQSLQAQDIMNRLSASLPTMENLVKEVETFTQAGDYAVSPHIIDVILPMLCSYLSTWYYRGPDNAHPDDTTVTKVTTDHLNQTLTQVLTLIRNNIGDPKATWMVRIAAVVGQIVLNSSASLLNDRILPIAIKLRENTKSAHANEEVLRHGQRLGDDLSSVEASVGEEYAVLIRDLYAFYPIVIRYAEIHKAQWIRDNHGQAEQLYAEVSEVFNHWMKSQHFKREELNFLSGNDVDVNALISAGPRGICRIMTQSGASSGSSKKKRKRDKKDVKKDQAAQQSLIVVCLKRLLPVGLNLFTGREQELVQKAKERMLRHEPTEVLEEFVKAELMLPDQPDPADRKAWQRKLYIKIGKKQVAKLDDLVEEESSTVVVERILAMSKVLQGLHLVDHPPAITGDTWRKLVSTQRKRAIIACFRMVALYSLPRHRAINLFLPAYRDLWLSDENQGQEVMIANLTEPLGGDPSKTVHLATMHPDAEEPVHTDQLEQIVTAFSRAATTENRNDNFVSLYLHYADIMSMSCGGADEEEDEEGGDEEAGPSMQEQELERQKLLWEQGRLADRGVAEMVLMYISASNGEPNDTVWSTLTLGISILRGGNTTVQKRMAEYLKEKRDVGFFNSMAGLMNAAGVLNLDAFERIMKAEGLGVSSAESNPTEANNAEAENTCKIFRFLQLLCEGHNLEFQNYLRTQQGNTATVNLVICTVDYLLRLQESVMDFYWHYSSKEFVDAAGIVEFNRAMKIAGQVFNSLTEFIQGPCPGNQLTLAHSRLWDAVGGFFFLFAHMTDKLAKAKETSQLDMLSGFLDLQNEMVTMLISMLEGNTLNGPIGRQMVDSLAESSQNLDMIIKFFDIFLKLEELVNSASFQEFDPGHTGWITTQDLKKAMESQKIYDAEQVAYLLACVSSQDGKVDYIEFTERFSGQAQDIGFNSALLLTNLSEHITNDARLQRILDVADSMLKSFENKLGRIEIIGGARRIERVYFEISEQNLQQWEKPQIKESKRAFLHNVVNESGDKGKLEIFVDFCEDAIFEMQHAASISVKEPPPMKQALPPSLDLIEVESTWESTKKLLGKVIGGVKSIVHTLTPGNVRRKVARWKRMTYPQLAWASFKGFLWMVYYIIYFQIFVMKTTGRFLLYMMTGYSFDSAKDTATESSTTAPAKAPDLNPRNIYGMSKAFKMEDAGAGPVSAFGISLNANAAPVDDVEHVPHYDVIHETIHSNGSIPDFEEQKIVPGRKPDALLAIREGTGELETAEVELASLSPRLHHAVAGEDENTGAATALIQERKEAAEEEATGESKSSFGTSFNSMLNFFARNFYNFQTAGLGVAFLINAILLCYRVTDASGGLSFDRSDEDDSERVATIATDLENAGDNAGRDEIIMIDQTNPYQYYLGITIRLMAMVHTLVALVKLAAYYHLKVPLAIFKREKEVARKLEFEGMWIAKQPEGYYPDMDNIRSRWDALVISSEAFPENYWDKFVKKKVLAKYKETHDIGMIMRTLGLKVTANEFGNDSKDAESSQKAGLRSIDWKYRIWKLGVICTDKAFLYNIAYLVFSILGNFNYFFFAAHLVDVANISKPLSTILQSVTHNGRQLLLTVMLMSIVVYLYTVLAFNFFRKFYVQEGEEEGEPPDAKCHNMLTCFIFHIYNGVRNGGGVGDAIQEPDGDPLELQRIVFDMTFFFFIVVILLAIVQGLIIDAFGDLRDQLQQVSDDMESNCFICEMGKDYFDKVPHGFEQHTQQEHNLANYLFFLMHLINKDQTEYTGQETYVWQLYQQRCWDFFPVGDCFRKQYEQELGA
ncbi:ryanodine receptor-like isoform X3 [Paramacrobiotus metropolitanus]|uniref:ryanodine receptor-like isoform X3 n=1 Tax=Paramacrobiotus metropolitanus TaxID=2943436 RepID=UPI0024459C94|nr:ryanodine receptor-like isoform X3 [Paramacrobiotus metropolitanus]